MGLQRPMAPAVLLAGLAAAALGSIRPADAQSGTQSGAPPTHGGCLSFHQVHPGVRVYGALQDGVPAGFRIYLIRGSDRREEGLVVNETPVVVGSDLADASASVDPSTLQPAILLRFDTAGTRKLAAFTSANIGRALAVVIDGRVFSAPMIVEPILGGSAQIGGTLTKADADKIAAKLRSKACRGN